MCTAPRTCKPGECSTWNMLGSDIPGALHRRVDYILSSGLTGRIGLVAEYD